MAKTDWTMSDTILPADMNGIGEEINANTSAISEKMDKTAASDLNMSNRNIHNINKFHLRQASVLTIASGAITVTQSYHTVDTEGMAETDELDTISGGVVGDRLILRQVHSSRDVTIRHNAGNIFTFDGADVVMLSSSSTVELLKYGADLWLVIGVQGLKRIGDTMTGRLRLHGDHTFFRRDNEPAGQRSYSFNIANEAFRLFALNESDNWARTLFSVNHAGTEVAFLNGNGKFMHATVAPEGNVTAPQGTFLFKNNAPAGLYFKETGSGNMGWKQVVLS